LVHLLWLFAIQRVCVHDSARRDGRHPAYTDAAKEERRDMRRQKGTDKQLRHPADSKRLTEQKERRKKTQEEAAQQHQHADSI